jgi:hypothetical protein
MSAQNLHEMSIARAQMRAVRLRMGKPFAFLPVQSAMAALCKHGGLTTLLDPDLMTARIAAFPPASSDKPEVSASEIAERLRAVASNFFYKLVDRPGYTVHSELLAYLAEPGVGNGVIYDESRNAVSQRVPAAFTFVGQFIDHDLTFNPMNLTADESGTVVPDNASPLIDLDNVYGPRNVSADFQFENVFDGDGRFRLRPVGRGFDLLRDEDPKSPTYGMATILDPRNDENQLILQIHILLQRLHNKIIDKKVIVPGPNGLGNPTAFFEFIGRVRAEVVATWQSFVLNEYMPTVLRKEVLKHVLEQIHVRATDVNDPQQQYGDLKHKPYRDLVTGKNVVRMPHEFALGFRFGHSQLRPFYKLNETSVVILFKDARASDVVTIDGIQVSGRNDLRGGRDLEPEHVIDWSVFYPVKPEDVARSMRIDQKVTARVFNLPESAIPDDIKYVGNLPFRNLLRGSQIGVVSGEELARFYGYPHLTTKEVLGDDDREPVRALFEMDHEPGVPGKFKTPLWYYILKEAEMVSRGEQLGTVGSRLVAEVLAGAIYYGNDFPYADDWHPKAVQPTGEVVYKPGGSDPKNAVRLQDILDYVLAP